MSKYDFKRIILCAGHGGADPGSVNGQYREADQTITIVNKVNNKLSNIGVPTLVVPHDLDFIPSTNWINNNWKDEDLVIEAHRDSFPTVGSNESSTRLGVYGIGEDNYSMELANALGSIFKRKSGNKNSWVRPDTVIGGLYLIRNTKPTALLVEMGFMQGRNDDDHIEWLAQVLFESIVELIGFKKNNDTQIIMNTTNIDPYLPARNAIEVQGWIYEERRKVINNAISAKDINYICYELAWAAEGWVKNEEVIKGNLKTISELNNKLKDTEVVTTIPSGEDNTQPVEDMSNNINFSILLYRLLDKFTSRKLWVAIIGLAVPYLNAHYNWSISITEVLAMLGFGATYIYTQSKVDISES